MKFPPINLLNRPKQKKDFMLICLDFDETYTVDPVFWDKFILLAQSAGHKVICCTSRYPGHSAEVLDFLGDRIEIYFSAHKAKKDVLHACGIYPDIWIDDKPKHIYKDR